MKSIYFRNNGHLNQLPVWYCSGGHSLAANRNSCPTCHEAKDDKIWGDISAVIVLDKMEVAEYKLEPEQLRELTTVDRFYVFAASLLGYDVSSYW